MERGTRIEIEEDTDGGRRMFDAPPQRYEQLGHPATRLADCSQGGVAGIRLSRVRSNAGSGGGLRVLLQVFELGTDWLAICIEKGAFRYRGISCAF